MYERNTIPSHLPGTLKVFFLMTFHFFFLNNATLFISRGSAQLSCFTENRDLDFSIRNVGFDFAVEICDFSVFVIIAELSFLLRN